jgi:hypothetical protein
MILTIKEAAEMTKTQMSKETQYGMFTAVCLETLDSLEANEARINAQGRKLLEWLRRRYLTRETVFDNGEVRVTKIPLYHPLYSPKITLRLG